MKKPVRILLADDHAMVRDGLQAIFAGQDGMEVIATASNGREAVQQAKRTKPDVALIDVVMPKMNGIEATTQIHRALPAVRIVVISAHSDIVYVYRALKAGAQGYVAKASAASHLVEAVNTVLSGRRFLGPGIAESVLEDYIHARAAKSPLEQLSARERQILQLLSEGYGSATIGRMLSLSPKTVDTYRSRLMEKLGIAEFPALIKFAIQHGITPSG